ncbi:uncharacterized protein EV420DRAFT_1122697 [Desarmillaria tabescens]|uniref:Uncharacterized protein n=1 Tax=Armillaria tabescens TaxID=1929756 RepID=A0AA39JEE8_ARMTA|nr:uncharacterized protein EV420DRAFT_1122697 [Desarmillaria tabescens]KAK0441247.1 hypothetical protein EV420DRAFT_1122697 [Desarmillaria tabescens]
MCIGDYMGECPPGVLTSEEMAKIKQCPGYSDDYPTGKTLYRFASHYYARIKYRTRINLQGMVLRNLTKHVYVQQDVVVEELKRSGRGGDIGNVLLMNICWSDDPSSAMPVDPSGGGWAGDRFDVVPLSSVENDEEDWEDVTEDQANLPD